MYLPLYHYVYMHTKLYTPSLYSECNLNLIMHSFLHFWKEVSSWNISSFNFLYSVLEQGNYLGNSQSLFYVSLNSILSSRLFLLSFQKFCPHLCAVLVLFLSFISVAPSGIHSLLFGFPYPPIILLQFPVLLFVSVTFSFISLKTLKFTDF